MATTTRRPRGQGRPHASAPGASREALLDAAAGLFGRQGIAATTMAQIAAEAGVTAAMVHYHFAGREALLDALVEARIAPLLAYVWAPVPPVPDDTPLPEQIELLVHRLLEGPGRTPWLPPLWIREVLSEGGLLRERVLARLPVARLQALGATVAAGQVRGEVNPDLDPRLLVLSILGLTMLPLATAGLWGRLPGAEGIGAEAIARHATALLTAGLRPNRRSR
ncbi:MAG TPA: helix-turn-helix domain-containing protein [Holophagaceae bacterium]|nr:helix-turn-helix domain-containing protein [Holophagaceae bacterium]